MPEAMRTTIPGQIIADLIELARTINLALDDSEEFEGEDGRAHAITAPHFDDVCDALHRLEELPDDKPGMTMGPADKAAWALRRLLAGGTRLTEYDERTIRLLLSKGQKGMATMPPADVERLERLLANSEATLDAPEPSVPQTAAETAAMIAVLADLLRDTLGPLEVSADEVENDDAALMGDLITRIKSALDQYDGGRYRAAGGAA